MEVRKVIEKSAKTKTANEQIMIEHTRYVYHKRLSFEQVVEHFTNGGELKKGANRTETVSLMRKGIKGVKRQLTDKVVTQVCW